MTRGDSEKTRRTIYVLISISFLLSVAIRIYLTAVRRFDPDEFEHLHAAWMIYSGYLPYRDFWQNHTPLLYYALAPFFHLIKEGVPVTFAIRSFLSATAFLILWLIYRLARIDNDRQTALLAVMVLSCSYLFLHKTIEIRPDQLLVVCWLGSLLLVVRGTRIQPQPLALLLGGILLGTAMLLSPKALLCATATIVMISADWALNRSSREILQIFRSCLLYTIGFVIPLSAAILFFVNRGIAELFLQSTILGNLTFPEGSKLGYLIGLRYIALFLLGAAGLFVCYKNQKWFEGHGSMSLFVVPMVFLILVFLFFLPTTNPQTALVFIPFVAIYAGVAIKEAIERYYSKRHLESVLVLALAFLLGVAVPCVSAVYEKTSTPTNQRQREVIATVIRQTKPQDTFFDGNVAYVFRRQAYYYGSLIEAIRTKIERGEIQQSIPEALQNVRCKFVIYDDRVSLLPESIQIFIRNNYIPSELPEIYVAGKNLDANSFSGPRAKFRIDIPQTYSISLSNSRRFRVDGKLYGGAVYLDAGTHEIVADQPLQSVLIRAE